VAQPSKEICIALIRTLQDETKVSLQLTVALLHTQWLKCKSAYHIRRKCEEDALRKMKKITTPTEANSIPVNSQNASSYSSKKKMRASYFQGHFLGKTPKNYNIVVKCSRLLSKFEFLLPKGEQGLSFSRTFVGRTHNNDQIRVQGLSLAKVNGEHW